MAEARAAMRAGEWARARTQLQRHAEQFPAGALSDERRVSAVVVACWQGREEDALVDARLLLSGPVSDAATAALRASCVGDRLEHHL